MFSIAKFQVIEAYEAFVEVVEEVGYMFVHNILCCKPCNLGSIFLWLARLLHLMSMYESIQIL